MSNFQNLKKQLEELETKGFRAEMLIEDFVNKNNINDVDSDGNNLLLYLLIKKYNCHEIIIEKTNLLIKNNEGKNIFDYFDELCNFTQINNVFINLQKSLPDKKLIKSYINDLRKQRELIANEYTKFYEIRNKISIQDDLKVLQEQQKYINWLENDFKQRIKEFNEYLYFIE